ncbi:MAG: Gx transporter family protein [Clostridia bacterium]|nr:Gx transporter family protein [Clostridia bacterium]
MKKRFNTKRVALCGLLLAMMLILGWIEKQIPTPHPALKLGLSNSVLIFAVYMLDIPTAYVLMFFKVFLSNVLFGSLGVSFALGLAGGVVSLTAMVLISRVKGMHTVTVSIVGGVMHHVGQIVMALLVVNTPGLLAALPFLMIGGLIFGALTGVCADRVMRYMKHMKL